MSIPIDAYTNGGTLSGVISLGDHLREALELQAPLTIERCRRRALDGPTSGPPVDERVPSDDLVLVVADRDDLPVHAAWHDVALEIGPYEVDGSLPTLPGFDPGRALARPGGSYVLLRDATVRLLEAPSGGAIRHAALFVNRYAVDAVAADLMLGFFFPGARIAVRGRWGEAGGPLAHAT